MAAPCSHSTTLAWQHFPFSLFSHPHSLTIAESSTKLTTETPVNRCIRLSTWLIEQLTQYQGLEPFQRLDGRILVAMDGSQFHVSENIHRSQCSTRKDDSIENNQSALCATDSSSRLRSSTISSSFKTSKSCSPHHQPAASATLILPLVCTCAPLLTPNFIPTSIGVLFNNNFIIRITVRVTVTVKEIQALRYKVVNLVWLARAIFMGMGITWLPIEAYEGLTNADFKVSYCYYLLGSVAIGLSLFIFDGHFVGGFLKKKIVISSNSFDTHITIKFGNIFDQKGVKAIAVNNFFDSIVDDDLVSKRSLHGEVIEQYWHGNSEQWQEQVYDDLSDKGYDEIQRAKGNNRRYKNGTTARACAYDEEFLFVALGETNPDDNVSHATAASLIASVREMLVKARAVCANRPLNLPLIGSGLSRVGVKNAVLVDLILTAIFEETKAHKVTDSIVLVLPAGKRAEIDLGETQRSWS